MQRKVGPALAHSLQAQLRCIAQLCAQQELWRLQGAESAWSLLYLRLRSGVQGLGAYLMGVLGVIAKQQGMHKLMLTVLDANTAAVRPAILCMFCWGR